MSARGQGRGGPQQGANPGRGRGGDSRGAGDRGRGGPQQGFNPGRGGPQQGANPGRGRGGDSRGAGDRGRGGGYRGSGGGGRGRGSDGGDRGFYRDDFAVAKGVIFSPDNETLEAPDEAVTTKENALIRPREEISLSGLSLDDYTLPSRPSYGKQGRPIVLRTNYFKMTANPKAVIYRYNITISPQIKNPSGGVNRRKTRRLVELLIANNPPLQSAGVATDYGTMFITAAKLQLGGKSMNLEQKFFEAEDAGPRDTAINYKVKFEEDASMPVGDLLEYISSPPGTTPSGFDKGRIIQALNIIMTRTANERPAIYGGGNSNKFYTYPPSSDRWFDLGSGLIALKGFYTSVRTSTLRVLVNINVANAAYYPPMSLLGLMRTHTPQKANDARSGLEAFITKLKVSHQYLKKKRVKTVQGFSHPSPQSGHTYPPLGNARNLTFECPELQATGKISVMDYFKRKYQIVLKYPDEPCINLGTKQNPVFVPPELLEVEPGQPYGKKLSEDQTARMITFAVRKPAENARRIIGQGADMMGLSESNQNLVAFGVKVAPKMITVNARVLPAGMVQYKSKQNRPTPYPTARGNWDIRDKAFSDARQLRNWTFIKFVDNDINRADVDEFRKIARNCGINSDNPEPPNGVTTPIRPGKDFQDPNDKVIQNTLGVASQKGLKVLLVILPDNNAFIYSRVKFWAETRYGIQTICCVGLKFREKGPQYWANIAHKFNLKLGGLNQLLPADKLGYLKDGKTMLVGIDVTHPSPGSLKGSPSIAGVVASINGQYGQWPASMQAQKSREEMVQKLEEMFGERLELWQRHNKGGLPERIIIYRDGVSEGQYRKLLELELPQVRNACKKRYPGGRGPKISIVVCGKRHHTRFYPTRLEDADERGQQNPHNGTVVDRGVTMEKGWDFFLQAHYCLQGTAKPTHYVVVLDENSMDADGLESLTHNLCYMFGRATKAVSLCPPAYYADLLCERGRAYLYKDFNARENATVSSDQEFDWDRAEWIKGVHPSIKDSMFYI
ncbi:MAG: hypothetical protein Q9178_005367 [Gyalolechia marmorata]